MPSIQNLAAYPTAGLTVSENLALTENLNAFAKFVCGCYKTKKPT